MAANDRNRVIREAYGAARSFGATPLEMEALFEAGLVESGLQHARYSRVGSGDRDSVGFLQQRPSQGWGAPGESVRKDALQFLRAARKVRKSGFKGSSGQLAQAVQRSAFPDKYEQRDREAERILRSLGGKGGRRGGSSVTIPGQPGGVIPGVSSQEFYGARAPRPFPEVGSDGTAILQALREAQAPQMPSVSGIASPEFAAAPVMPVGYQPAAGGAAPIVRQGPDISALVDMARTAPGEIAPADPGPLVQQAGSPSIIVPGTADQTVRVEGGRQGRGGKHRWMAGGGYKGTQRPAMQTYELVKDLGLEVTSTKRHNTNPYSGSRSDHDHGNTDAFAVDMGGFGPRPTRKSDMAAVRVARALGIKGYKMGQPINKSVTVRTKGATFRVQMIYRGSGPAFGGNHFDHIHTGWRRIR